MEGSCHGTSAQPRSSATISTMFGGGEEAAPAHATTVSRSRAMSTERQPQVDCWKTVLKAREKSRNKFQRQVTIVAVILSRGT